MGFVVATVGTVVILVLIFYLLGRKYPAGGKAMASPMPAQTDTIRASQVERENPGIVQDDVRQMLAAQNALRERRGATPMTGDDLRRAVAEDEHHRSQGRGPFGVD